MSQVLKIEGLKRTFINGEIEVHALRGVDLEVDKGEFISLAGPSGSGKTTLFNLIGGLDSPTDGKVYLEAQDMGKMSAKELSALRLAKIGFVFQAYNLIPVLSAFENVEYPLLLRGLNSAKRRSRASDMLEAVGLKDMMHRRPDQLSGGQQQRVAVARALVGEPSLVLADEPTANLDSKTGLGLLSMMRELNEELGTTFLFSTHDNMVMRAAKRLLQLKDGKLISDEKRESQLREDEV